MRPPAARPKPFRLPLLLALALAVWLAATGKWTADAWQLPVSYSIDALETLARLKISGDHGPGLFFSQTLPGLGAPWVADWSAYAMPDMPFFLGVGWIARFIGLIPASNLALLIAHLAAVAAFYAGSRALGHRPVFAGGAALLFGFSFYIFYRGLSHYSFALAYVVPAQLVSVWLIGSSRRLLARRRWGCFCIATAVATGVGNPYFGFAYGQLLVFALAYQAATGRRPHNLRLGAACLGVFLVVLVAANCSAILALFGDTPAALQRNYAGTEVYGLRLIELFIPHSAHHWPAAGAFGARYASATALKGELFYGYVGLAGVCGLAVVLAGAARRLFAGQMGLRPAHPGTAGWLVLFFSVGGLNSFLAFTTGLNFFRAGNRYSIYLLALALFALASWASRRGRRLGTAATLAITVPFVALCLWDQVPRRLPETEAANIRQRLADDHATARALDAALPAGAAVFQLPAVPFLEQPPVNRMGDYELFRPWFFSTHVRFSYGLLANDRAHRWQRWVAAQPAAVLCAALERAGFAALYVHRAAFPDSAAALRAELAALGKKTVVEAGDHLVFALQPAAAPVRPDLADARLAEPWHGALGPDGPTQLFAATGWFPPERDGASSWRWAQATAVLAIWVPGDREVNARLEFEVAAMRRAQLTADLDGHEIWHTATVPEPALSVSLPLTLRPGTNRIRFHYDGAPLRPSATDPRPLCFRLENLRLRGTSPP